MILKPLCSKCVQLRHLPSFDEGHRLNILQIELALVPVPHTLPYRHRDPVEQHFLHNLTSRLVANRV